VKNKFIQVFALLFCIVCFLPATAYAGAIFTLTSPFPDPNDAAAVGRGRLTIDNNSELVSWLNDVEDQLSPSPPSLTPPPSWWSDVWEWSPSWITELEIRGGVTEINTEFGNLENLEFLNMSSATSLASIGASAFTDLDNIEAINMSGAGNLTSIGASAFSGLTSLTALTLPTYTGSNSLTIGDSAFANAGSINLLTIPNSVISIGNSAFRDSGIVTLNMADARRLTIIGNQAFEGCSALTNLTLPALSSAPPNLGILDIGTRAFAGAGLTGALQIPASVWRIDDQAFDGCANITSLDVNMTALRADLTIGNSAFRGCTNLGSLTITLAAGGTLTIHDSAFRELANLGALNLPASGSLVIGDNVFRGNAALTNITIPGSVMSIGDSAFRDCTGITALNMAAATNLTLIGPNAFRGCVSISNGLVIPSSVIEIGDFAFNTTTSLPSLQLAAAGNLTRIGAHSFEGSGITGQLNIPFSVTDVGAFAFNGVGITTLLIQAGPGNPLIIHNGAFQGTNISNTPFIIPDRVFEIGDAAFRNCTGITSLGLPQTGPLTIGNAAFYNTGISNLVIPGNVTHVGNNAFFGSSRLSAVAFRHTTPPSLGVSIFQNNLSPWLTLFVPNGSLAAYRPLAGSALPFPPGTRFVEMGSAGSTPEFAPDGTIIFPPDERFTVHLSRQTGIQMPDGVTILSLPGGTRIRPNRIIELPAFQPGGNAGPGTSAFIDTASGLALEIPAGSMILPSGAITLPPGRTATIMPPTGDRRPQVSASGGITIEPDGTVTLSGANEITMANGTKISLSSGRITTTAQLLRIHIGRGGAVISKPDGSIQNVLEGSAININPNGNIDVHDAAQSDGGGGSGCSASTTGAVLFLLLLPLIMRKIKMEKIKNGGADV